VKVGFVAQGQVDDSALARGHRAEVVRSAGLADLLGGDVGCGPQFLNAHRATILAVEADFLMLAGSKVQHLEREEFKGAQQLSAAVKQEGGVGPGEVYENFRLLPVAILRERRVDDNAVFEAKAAMSDYGLKELIDLIGGSNFVHKKLSAVSFQQTAQRDFYPVSGIAPGG
jgi:ABC-type iron transport system FetAB ATPase subunit